MLPPYSPVIASLKPSSWLYFQDAILGGEIKAWLRKCLSTSAVFIHTREPLRRCCGMSVWRNRRTLLVKHLEGYRWWACYTVKKAPDKGVTSQVCNLLWYGVRNPAFAVQRKSIVCACEMQKQGRCLRPCHLAKCWSKNTNKTMKCTVNETLHFRSYILEIKWKLFILNSIQGCATKKKKKRTKPCLFTSYY